MLGHTKLQGKTLFSLRKHPFIPRAHAKNYLGDFQHTLS